MAGSIVRVVLACAQCRRVLPEGARCAWPSPSTRLCAECLDRGAPASSAEGIHGCPGCDVATEGAVCPTCWAAATAQLARARADRATRDAQARSPCDVCSAAAVSRGHRFCWCEACVARFRLEAGAEVAVPHDGPRCAFCDRVAHNGFGTPPVALCVDCVDEASEVEEGSDLLPDAETVARRAGAASAALDGTRACSFCGRARHEVAVLVEGPAVALCDVCMRQCAPGVAPTTQDVPSRTGWASCSFNGISAGERGAIYVGAAGSICDLCASFMLCGFVEPYDRARVSRLRVATRDAAPCLLCHAEASDRSVVALSGASVCSTCLQQCRNRWTMPHRYGRFCVLCRAPESTAGRLAGVGDDVACRRCLDEHYEQRLDI